MLEHKWRRVLEEREKQRFMFKRARKAELTGCSHFEIHQSKAAKCRIRESCEVEVYVALFDGVALLEHRTPGSLALTPQFATNDEHRTHPTFPAVAALHTTTMNFASTMPTAFPPLARSHAVAHKPLATAFPSAPRPQPMKNAFVLNWEDVLAPMSLLHQRTGLQPSRQALAYAQQVLASEAYLQQALVAIELQVIELLRTASAMGPTFVVTERSLKFMEATCSLFFPRLALWLRHDGMSGVQVVAAPRSTFASDMEKSAWRVNLLQGVCRETVARGSNAETQQRVLRSPEFGTLGLVHVSASEMDTFACIKAIDVAPFLLPKCVHVHQQSSSESRPPSLEEFFAQLQTLQRYVVSSAAHPSAFSVNL